MTINEWRTLREQRLEEYEASAQRVLTWCEEKSVTPRQFYYWRRKLRSAESGIGNGIGGRPPSEQLVGDSRNHWSI